MTGAGSGINSSANSLALNTYFKEKRRIATGLSWTITGMGPILFPQIIAILIPWFDVQGSLLIFTGIALNAVVCALIFQPVQWHVKKPKTENLEESLMMPTVFQECDYCRMTKRQNPSILSSQYLYNADNANATGYEIIDPGIPMIALANDGWSSKRSLYGSRASLYSDRQSRIGSRKCSSQNLVNLNRSSSVNLAAMAKEREKRKISSHKIEEHPEDGSSSSKNSKENVDVTIRPKTPMTPKTPDIRVSIDAPLEMRYINDHQTDLTTNKLPFSRVTSPRRKISSSNNFNVEKEVLKSVSQKLEEFVTTGDRVPTITNLEGFCTCDEKLRMYLDPKLSDEHDNEVFEEIKQKHSLWQKIVVFFDLSLLCDFSYVNLMMGVTLGNFAELNFSLLTPFVLSEWGFEKRQIATAMSLLGGVDIAIRFFVPFIAGKIGWENKTFFLVGIFGMAMGRVCKLNFSKEKYLFFKKKGFFIEKMLFDRKKLLLLIYVFCSSTVITFYRSYIAILCAFCWIGLGKGLRTVFMALVIPSYVPLHRLPAASGLQLIFAGIFYFFMGPVVGK